MRCIMNWLRHELFAVGKRCGSEGALDKTLSVSFADTSPCKQGEAKEVVEDAPSFSSARRLETKLRLCLCDIYHLHITYTSKSRL